MLRIADVLDYLQQYPGTYYVVKSFDEVVPGLEMETIVMDWVFEQTVESRESRVDEEGRLASEWDSDPRIDPFEDDPY